MSAKWWQREGAWAVNECGDVFQSQKVEGNVGAWVQPLGGEQRFVLAKELDAMTPIDGPTGTKTPRHGWARVEVVDGGVVLFGRVEEDVLAGAGVIRVHALDEEGTRVFLMTMATPMVIELLTEEQARRGAVPDRDPCANFAPSSILAGYCMHCGASEEEDRRASVERKIASIYSVLGDDAELEFGWDSDEPGARLVSITSWSHEIAHERWEALVAAGLPLVERPAPTSAWEQGRWLKGAEGRIEERLYEVRPRTDGAYDARPVDGSLRDMWVARLDEIAERWVPATHRPWVIGTWKTRPLDGFWEARERTDGTYDLRPFGGELEASYEAVGAPYVRAEFVPAEDQEEARKQASAESVVVDLATGPATVPLPPPVARWAADAAPDATDEGGS